MSPLMTPQNPSFTENPYSQSPIENPYYQTPAGYTGHDQAAYPNYPDHPQQQGYATPPATPAYGTPNDLPAQGMYAPAPTYGQYDQYAHYGQPDAYGYAGYGAYAPPARPRNKGLTYGAIGGAILLGLLVLFAFSSLARGAGSTTGGSPTTPAIGHSTTNPTNPTNPTTPSTPTTPTSHSTPTTTGGGSNVIYADSMTDHPAGWYNGADCTEQNDGYHTNGGTCSAPISPVGNAEMQVTMRNVSTDSNSIMGIIFRESSANTAYMFELTQAGYWGAFIDENGAFVALANWTFNPVIHTGDGVSNTLIVEAVGSTFTFGINGVEVGQVSDSSIPAGGWGVGSGENSEVVFTNLSIIRPS